MGKNCIPTMDIPRKAKATEISRIGHTQLAFNNIIVTGVSVSTTQTTKKITNFVLFDMKSPL